MAADHRDLVRALGDEKGNLSHSRQSIEAKGVVRIGRSPGGKAEYLDLTAEDLNQVAQLTGSYD
jgi:hypothetical protein